MDKTKIDWCDSSWNPITGCLHDCQYCYARSMVKRFGEESLGGEALVELETPVRKYGSKVTPYPYGFTPTFHKYRLNDYLNKKGRNIFVCSMSDLFGDWVPIGWIEEIFDYCKASQQHNYLFLTKNPKRYSDLDFKLDNNIWLGTTINTLEDRQRAWDLCTFTDKTTNRFLSIEPIHGEISLNSLELLHKDYRSKYTIGRYIDWVIIGAETGNRKNKIAPKREWIEAIVNECKAAEVPVFMKSSLEAIWGEDLIQEFPKLLKQEKQL